MKRAKFFRYHVVGIIFWTLVPLSSYAMFCHYSLPACLQSTAIADVLGLLVIPGGALALWIVTMADRAIGGAYDEPTIWDELFEQSDRKP